VPPDRVITQIRQLVDQGYGEVVLTGVDVTSYGGDTGSDLSLGGLVLKILREVPDLARLRLSSLDPVEVDADLLRAVAEEERLMPHFHLSVQAGDDLILKRMKRRHLSGDVRELAGRLRDLRPGTVLGADVIVGFPTETEEMFQNSMRLVDDAGLTHLHVFPFSARAGTPAARMKKVPGDVVAQRSAALRAKGDAAMAALVQSKLGQTVKVLVEDDSRGFCEHYLPVRVSGDAAAGTLITATVTGISGGVLQA
jgi:threonylcarbamoyladenosine tRNA methylthiotransferase MtaB